MIDVDNTSYSSNFNYQKIAMKGSRTDSIPVGTTDITISHNLGRVTAARVWYEPANSRRFPAFNQPWQITENNSVGVMSYLTTNTLVIRVFNTVSTKNVKLWYRIYYDT